MVSPHFPIVGGASGMGILPMWLGMGGMGVSPMMPRSLAGQGFVCMDPRADSFSDRTAGFLL